VINFPPFAKTALAIAIPLAFSTFIEAQQATPSIIVGVASTKQSQPEVTKNGYALGVIKDNEGLEVEMLIVDSYDRSLTLLEGEFITLFDSDPQETAIETSLISQYQVLAIHKNDSGDVVSVEVAKVLTGQAGTGISQETLTWAVSTRAQQGLDPGMNIPNDNALILDRYTLAFNGIDGGDGANVLGHNGDPGTPVLIIPPVGIQNTIDLISPASSQTGYSIVSEFLPGVLLSSYGGNGGDGGSGVGVTPGYGGAGSYSIDLSLLNNVDVETSGVLPSIPGVLISPVNNGHGVVVASLGGDGGDGGDADSVYNNDSNKGGNGANSGNVNLVNEASISTSGDNQYGLLAVSYGGVGGDAGPGVEVAGEGGSGGNGGSAGTVTVENSGSISTTGDFSHGIYGKSGGGNGGTSKFNAAFFGGSGDGGKGGAGALVDLTNTGSIFTKGDSAVGVIGQSMGGGGGGAGFSFGWVSIAGDGAIGGSADKVIVNNEGLVKTTGDKASGLVAQSIGGGGGYGGDSLSVGIIGAVSIGGDGGDGNLGGEVEVRLDSADDGTASIISTSGENAFGILAQSIGGSGGGAGDTHAYAIGTGVTAAVAVGGTGGTGNNSAKASLHGEGTVITSGNHSTAIKIESIGGGGGNSGTTIAGSLQVPVDGGAGGVAASVAVGGSGGGSGDGGEVYVDFNGAVATYGEASAGVFTQSIGGGGGSAGLTAAGSFSVGEAAGAVSVAVGGSGGSGGSGGHVTTILDGMVATLGDLSTGVLIQSIGGGGGNSGFTAAGSFAGSAAGGGTVSVSIGGDGGEGNTGGNIDANIGSHISTGTTTTFASAGLIVQSIGGGGGNSGTTVAGGLSVSGGSGGSIDVGLGGSGGVGAHGGNVGLDYDGNITTNGSHSVGILAQSVGGGGGNAGGTYTAALSGNAKSGASVSIGIGGSGEGGGDGGIVRNEQGDLLVDEAGNEIKTVNVVIGHKSEEQGTSTIITRGEHSSGIVVQSIGGGGGNGGHNGSGAFTGGGGSNAGISVGIGGDGASAGDGHGVDANIIAKVMTLGEKSGAVVVQSIGGGGGNGGANVTASMSASMENSATVSVGLGGDGSAGGDGGVVDFSFTSTDLPDTTSQDAIDYMTLDYGVSTFGDKSVGILAQSVGGGGGNGGFDINFAATAAGGKGVGISVSLGGSGDSGGAGDDVELNVLSNVYTDKSHSAAVIAQSIGGGGGNGGFDISVGATATVSSGAAFAVGFGGSGGEGNSSGNVISDVQGHIFTKSDHSAGVIVQSVAGGGGSGGMNISGSLSGSKDNTGGLSFGMGGSGGEGGVSADVNNIFVGSIYTNGYHSTGLVTQSIGGGGGHGGMNLNGNITMTASKGASVGIGIGGSGESGGDSGDVNSTLIGDVTTIGDMAVAVLAQSVGGGGGNGGTNISGAALLSKGTSGSIGVGIGGSGGAAADSGNVALNINGDITTLGEFSSAVIAQSLGGGGGNGGMNIAGAVTLKGKDGTGVGVSFGVGGFGDGGGSAGNVLLDFEGNILVRPEDLALRKLVSSYEIEALSDEEALEEYSSLDEYRNFYEDRGFVYDANALTWTRDVYEDVNSIQHGILAQSVGGGGGNGGLNFSGGISYGSDGDAHSLQIGVGGFGGAGGNAGNLAADTADDTKNVEVNVTGGGTIDVLGNYSMGIIAQSVGGGGGNGGINISGGINSDAGIVFGMGGFGGDAGTASHVLVNAQTDIKTEGVLGFGLLAQSIGGGGGNGGFNASGVFGINKDSNLPALTIGIGGSGGAGALSGDVDVVHSGNIETNGIYAHGIMAQSVAGGGGNGGANITGSIVKGKGGDAGSLSNLPILIGVGGSAGIGADAGDVVLNSNGDIQTYSDFSRGLFAQSIGGGGGNGGYNIVANLTESGNPISIAVGGSGDTGGDAGDVEVVRGSAEVATGRISTNGISSHGIEASSLGGGGGNASFSGVLSYSENASTDAEGSSAYAMSVVIGGGGANAGSGGDANVNHFGDIYTIKEASHGIFAQSIGGGGGNANIVLASTNSEKARGLNILLGGATGEAGVGGKAHIIHEGNILTVGENSFGLFAQSVGGGGGNAGTKKPTLNVERENIDIGIGRIGGSGGTGGEVIISSLGAIETQGAGAYGILAQSIGSGGGNSSASTFNGATTDLGKDDKKHTVTLTIGQKGGEGGESGSVNVNTQGSVITGGEKAHAIYAQSVGGGGGNGGADGNGTDTFSFSLGGNGGLGGFGGAVLVMSGADLLTTGNNAFGILAQSVGGGGGAGGAILFEGNQSESERTFNIGVGGKGGTGNVGGTVEVGNLGQIVTEGEGSYGILAQSIGGGGGNAGMVTSRTSGTTGKLNVTVLVGGQGGEGRDGNNVIVNNSGLIRTMDHDSIGIMAQSIGGGGGNSSAVRSIQLAEKTDDDGFFLSTRLGGQGGIAGNVTVNNTELADELNSGVIYTSGDNAHGIFAMSVGGGGGDSGEVYNVLRSQSGSSGSDTTHTFGITLGGDGGVGGEAGVVNVTNDGLIVTEGADAHGIVAQSVGGGGGNASVTFTAIVSFDKNDVTGTFSLGGDGGSGNKSKDVTVTNSGHIETFGGGSYGLFAQSVGGGGGIGGSAFAFSTPTDASALFTNLAVGGNGGDGADSGDVIINHSGSIRTHGDNTFGIFAQSVSGGGGAASHNYSSPVAMAANAIVETIMGNTEGGTGKVGDVILTTTGSIETSGKNSQAYYVNHVNGGGGNTNVYMDVSQTAGANAQGSVVDLSPEEVPSLTISSINSLGADFLPTSSSAISDQIASVVSLFHTGDVSTTGDKSTGYRIQNVSGGGGHSSIDLVVNEDAQIDLRQELGGRNSPGSVGDKVAFTRDGNVLTTGKQATALSVQSIGGGGGTSYISVDVVEDKSFATPTPNFINTTAAAKVSAVSSQVSETLQAHATLALGSNAGNEDHGGSIDLNFSGNVLTMANHSTGLLIQSIGSGGGEVNMNGLSTVDIALGGSEGAMGNGGDIILTNLGGVYTEGELSHGVILQSIGGGGGIVSTDIAADDITFELNSDNSGNGGAINFTQTGDLRVNGDQSIALVAQSLGGGGGLVDRVFAGSAGGDGESGEINLTIDGNIIATGEAGVAVFAQSLGKDGQGNISLSLSENSMIYAGANGTGVWMQGGADNHIVNHGSVMTADGLAGSAVLGFDGNDRVENYNVFYGQFDLGAGDNTFTNHLGGTLISGSTLSLGLADNVLVNNGSMMAGDVNLAQKTDLNGSFVQSVTGTSYIELDFVSQEVDHLSVTGSIDLAGELNLTLLNPELVRSGSFSNVLFSGEQGVTDNGVNLITAASVVITYALSFEDPDVATLNHQVDFSPIGLSQNLEDVGDYFNRVQNAGSSVALKDTVIKMLYDPTMDELRNDLSQMSPDFYGEIQADIIRSNQNFSTSMLSCHQTRGAYQIEAESGCSWFEFVNEKTKQDAHAGYKDRRSSERRIAAGFERSINDWMLGLSVSTANTSSNGYEGRWQSVGKTDQYGISMKHPIGPAQFSAALGYGKNETSARRTGFITNDFSTNLVREVDVLSSVFRLSNDYYWDNRYFRPALNLGLTRTMSSAAEENDGGALNLLLEKQNQNHAWILPSLEFGGYHKFETGIKLKTSFNLGYQYYFDNDSTQVRAGLMGAPLGIDLMAVDIELGSSVHGDLGFELEFGDDVFMKFQYSVIKADNSEMTSGTINLNMLF
jgi:hypothetical protein